MKIAVVGTGYVGLVAGACFAENGTDVTCVDIDVAKIEGLRQNILPIYEPGLDELVIRNQAHKRLTFTTDIDAAIRQSSVIFIAVGTPPGEDGSADLQHVLAVADRIGRCASQETVVVNKSTVPVGTAPLVKQAVERNATFPVHVASNPEFLKEGSAVDDFLRPDRVVIGVDSERARTVLAELYAPFLRTGRPLLVMDVASAEMTKYAANGMLATRITFMNEIAALCESTGARIDHVRRGIGADERIGSSFLFPGPGYGGSCFPKDVKALVKTAQQFDTPLSILSAVDSSNERQKRTLGHKVRKALAEIGVDTLVGTHIAVWGMAFKPNTDDMRESPAITLVEDLLAWGATICAHDPVALTEARRHFGERIAYASINYDALQGADALVVVTDWMEYRHPDFDRILKSLRRPVVVDGRNLYDVQAMQDLGFTYHSIGRPSCTVVLS